MRKIVGIKYIAPFYDGSGYAKASREYVLALHKQGVPLTIKPISFETQRPDLGEDTLVLDSLIDKPIEYSHVVIQTTPEFWEKYTEPGKINIGYTVWETDRIYPDWVTYMNSTVDAILVPCNWNLDVFKDCGVSKPIKVVPHVVKSVSINKSRSELSELYGVSDNTTVFYSINQWQERKNPLGTIKSYWTAFQNNEDVAFFYKTYRSNYSESEKNIIRTTIKSLKRMMPLLTYPRIYLLLDMLSEEGISSLHARGDCYLSLDRGEGFGLSTATAASFGKPIVTTSFGGVLQYLDDDNSYLVDYVNTPVSGMPWTKWYLGTQNWAEASPTHAANLLRDVYCNKKKANAKGNLLANKMKSEYSASAIGKLFLSTLESLMRELN